MKIISYCLLVTVMAFALACGQPPPGPGAGEVESSSDKQVSFRVETVASGLQVPWSIAWAPDGRMFFTERPGRVRVFAHGQLRSEPLITLTDVEPSGESGLMSLALHPQFATNHLLYVSYAYRGDTQLVRVVRYRETEAGLTDRKSHNREHSCSAVSRRMQTGLWTRWQALCHHRRCN